MIKPPAVGTLLNDKEIASLARRHGRSAVKFILNKILDEIRESQKEKTIKSVKKQLRAGLERLYDLPLKGIINATGVLLHTNLGRSPLPEERLKEISETLSGYINLEYDLNEGKRGQREGYLADYCKALFGKNYLPILVNNNAASLLLILNTFSNRKEAIISRGELVEIGGSFRIPDILKSGGAKLKEVGTTNITSIKDYKNAVSEKTGIILKVHRSNFYQEGHVKSVDLKDLLSLNTGKDVPIAFDLGGGLLDGDKGFIEEETIMNAANLNCPIICFSMDKWMGGMQGGMILTHEKHYNNLVKNPMIRALRVDKVTLLFTLSILRDYIFGRGDSLPLWLLIKESEENLKNRAEKIISALKRKFPFLNLGLERIESPIGGGSSPAASITDYAIILNDKEVDMLTRNLRLGSPPVVARVHENRLYIHLRTVFQKQDVKLIDALIAAIHLLEAPSKQLSH